MCKTKDINLISTLDSHLVKTMENFQLAFIIFGRDLIHDSSAELRVGDREAQRKHFHNDFHLKGNTGHTSTFYDFDASTIGKH